MRQQGLDFRAKQEPFRTEMIVKWLNPQSVAGAEETPRACIPDCKGKHPAQVLYRNELILLRELKDGCSIAATRVTMAGSFEVGSQFLVIGNLAVDNHP